MRRLAISLALLALLVAPAFGATWNRPGHPLAVSSTTDNAIVRFDGTSGAQQNSGVTIDDSGNVALAPGATVDGKDVSTLGTGDVVGPASSTDNAICRFDLTTGKLLQNSVATVADTGQIATSGGLTANGTIQARATTGIPAGGTAGSGFTFYSATNFGIFGGSGAPTLSAAKGSLYLRSDGTTTNDRLYVNTDGGTTWTPVTTGS